MSNRINNEEEIFNRIRDEHIILSNDVWEILYGSICEKLTGISLIMSLYLDKKEVIPKEELIRIQEYVEEISNVVSRVLNPDIVKKDNNFFIKSKEYFIAKPIKDLFNHYTRNDLHIIGMIIGYSLDSYDDEPISRQDMQKVLDRVNSIVEMFNRIRQAAISEETKAEIIRNKIEFPMAYIEGCIKRASKEDHDKLQRCYDNLKKIREIL